LDLFNRLATGGYEAAEALIGERHAETYFLDFKRSKTDGRGSRLADNDRNNLAKAVSGFSNSEGGLIVWGIDCRPDTAGADLPSETHLLVDSAAFASRLEGTASGVTVPPVTGIENRPLPKSQGAPAGLVVTFVPKSPRAPHQSVPDSRYYIRSGSDFVPAPHGVLAGLWGRRPEPHLFHQFVSEPPRVSADGQLDWNVGFVLVNDGPGLARDVFVTIDSFVPRGGRLTFEPDEVMESHGWLKVHLSAVTRAGFRLPPGGRLSPVVLRLHLEPPYEHGWKLTLNYGCEGNPTRQLGSALSADELNGLLSSGSATEERLGEKFFGNGGLARREEFAKER
jgi:hypothetical protein